MSADTSSATNKRKPGSDTALFPDQKRQRQSIINDPVAISFLEGLGLDEKFFDGGKVLAWGLLPDDPDYLRIAQYVESGQGSGPSLFKITIQSILRIIPNVHTFEQVDDVEVDFKNDPNATGMKRMMLWHGTKRDYLKSILENGLRLPQNRQGRFGAGIYFADSVCKSYAFTDSYTRDHYLLLCDVVLGNTYKAMVWDPTLRKAPSTNLAPWWKIWDQEWVPCQSVMWDTGNGPNPLGNVTVDGCTWPLGNVAPWSWTHNEYIVYDIKQVRPKFLLKVKCTFK